MRALERIEAFTGGAKERLSGSGKRMLARVALVGAMSAGFVGVGVVIDGGNNRAEAASVYDFMSGSKEKEWCRWPSRWNICNKAKSLADMSLTDAQDIAARNDTSVHNGSPDAFRHCEWNGAMTVAFGGGESGAGTAKGFADRHEESSNDQPKHEREMDHYNNQVGREIGMNAGSIDEVRERCTNAIGKSLAWIAPLR